MFSAEVSHFRSKDVLRSMFSDFLEEFPLVTFENLGIQGFQSAPVAT